MFTSGESNLGLRVLYAVVAGLVLGSVTYSADGRRTPRPPASEEAVEPPDVARYAKWIAAFVVGRIAVSPFGTNPTALELLVLTPAVAILFARMRMNSERTAFAGSDGSERSPTRPQL